MPAAMLLPYVACCTLIAHGKDVTQFAPNASAQSQSPFSALQQVARPAESQTCSQASVHFQILDYRW